MKILEPIPVKFESKYENALSPIKLKKVWNMSFHLDLMYDKSIFICSNN